MLEEEIFKKSIFIPEKCLQYGFIKNKNGLVYKKDILNHEFEVNVEINNNKLKARVIEKELNEEYLNYRIENQTGEFVNSIREELIRILEDIKDKCTFQNTFVYPQSNRISNWIKETYNEVPEYLWENEEDAVFRNKANKKWFGIIMYINKNKLDHEDKKVEVMNIKLPPETIDDLVKQKGFYRAYHMNKKYWISFLLDDTIKDDQLKELIKISYQYTVETKDWVIPANPKIWDIIHCFDHKDVIEWKQINSISQMDYVYIYVGKPYSCILYKCQVIEKDIPSIYKEFDTCMKIKMIKRYEPEDYTFEVLKKYDLKAIRGPRRIPIKLLKLMEKRG